MSGDGAAAVLAELVDRSVEIIAASAADPRRFDRREVGLIADLWEDHTQDFFGTIRSRLLRDRRARAALRAMAAAGPERRTWMLRTGGPAMEQLLGRTATEPPYHRDFGGLVRPNPGTLSVDEVADDYDLSGARLRWISIERTESFLRGLAALDVPRRFEPGAGMIQVTLDGVRDVFFDSADTTGAELRRNGDGCTFRLGEESVLRTDDARLFPVDSRWHLSKAGRAADRVTPRRKPSTTGDDFEDGWPSGPEWDAASAFQAAMRRIRRVRKPAEAGLVPLAELAEALSGAGTAALAAAGLPPAERTAAFRRLTERWSGVGPDSTETRDHLPDGAWLTLIMYESDPAAVTVNYTHPETGRLVGAELPWPGRVALSNAGDELKVTEFR